MQIDVFTILPHAFSWLTEQRPLAAVLGSELELKLLNYRDFTPLSGGQVDDEPYGGGAGMVLRVDVVYAALEAVYGAERPMGVAVSADARSADTIGILPRVVEEERANGTDVRLVFAPERQQQAVPLRGHVGHGRMGGLECIACGDLDEVAAFAFAALM